MGISFQHLIILAIILILLGPKRLPEVAHMLGKAYRNFRDILDGVNEARFKKISEEIVEPKNHDRPKNTVDMHASEEPTPETDSPKKTEKS